MVLTNEVLWLWQSFVFTMSLIMLWEVRKSPLHVLWFDLFLFVLNFGAWSLFEFVVVAQNYMGETGVILQCVAMTRMIRFGFSLVMLRLSIVFWWRERYR